MTTNNHKDKSTENKRDLRKYVTFSNVSNLILMLLMTVFLFSADAKSLVIEGLMKIGLFQPDIPNPGSTSEIPIPTTTAAFQDVRFMDTEGNVVQLAEQKGKVIFINFWAVWCPPCIAEMPTISRLYEKYKSNEGVMFLMVDVDGNIEKSTSFMKKKGFQLPVHIPGSKLPAELFAGSMPTTVILDKSGNIAFHHVGGADYSNPNITDFINKLLIQ